MTAATIEAQEEFLLARRRLGIIPISMSIAAAWMWAPALLVAAQLGYLFGAWGVFWFSVPNIIAVLLFGPVAVAARRALPDGATFAGFQRAEHSRRVLGLFLAKDGMATFTNMLANVTAGAFVLSLVTGWSYVFCAVAIAAIPLAYTLVGGFRISTLTDVFTVTAILGIVGVAAIATIGQAGIATIAAGWGGTAGMEPALIAAGLGVTLTIHLLAAPYSDQTLWQRAWAARPEDVNKAFLLGGLMFAPVPLLCGALGIVAAGTGIVLDDPQRALFASVETYLAPVAIAAIVFAIVLAIVDTLDSAMSATSAFVGDRHTLGWGVGASRIVMLLATVLVVAVALLALPIFSIQLLYGALSGAALLPGLLTLFRRGSVTERGVFWGMVGAFALGLPVFLYGMFGGGGDTVVAIGLAITVGLAGVLALVISRLTR